MIKAESNLMEFFDTVTVGDVFEIRGKFVKITSVGVRVNDRQGKQMIACIGKDISNTGYQIIASQSEEEAKDCFINIYPLDSHGKAIVNRLDMI